MAKGATKGGNTLLSRSELAGVSPTPVLSLGSQSTAWGFAVWRVNSDRFRAATREFADSAYTAR